MDGLTLIQNNKCVCFLPFSWKRSSKVDDRLDWLWVEKYPKRIPRRPAGYSQQDTLGLRGLIRSPSWSPLARAFKMGHRRLRWWKGWFRIVKKSSPRGIPFCTGLLPTFPCRKVRFHKGKVTKKKMQKKSTIMNSASPSIKMALKLPASTTIRP